VDVCPEALNKVAWAADGKSLAVGNSSGTVHLYNIGDKVGFLLQYVSYEHNIDSV